MVSGTHCGDTDHRVLRGAVAVAQALGGSLGQGSGGSVQQQHALGMVGQHSHSSPSGAVAEQQQQLRHSDDKSKLQLRTPEIRHRAAWAQPGDGE